MSSMTPSERPPRFGRIGRPSKPQSEPASSKRPPHAFVTPKHFANLRDPDDDDPLPSKRPGRWHPVATSSPELEASSSPRSGDANTPKRALRNPKRRAPLAVSSRKSLPKSPPCIPVVTNVVRRSELVLVRPSQLDDDQFLHVASNDVPRIDILQSRRPFLGNVTDTAFAHVHARVKKGKPLLARSEFLQPAVTYSPVVKEKRRAAAPKKQVSSRRKAATRSLAVVKDSKRYAALDLVPACTPTAQTPARTPDTRSSRTRYRIKQLRFASVPPEPASIRPYQSQPGNSFALPTLSPYQPLPTFLAPATHSPRVLVAETQAARLPPTQLSSRVHEHLDETALRSAPDLDFLRSVVPNAPLPGNSGFEFPIDSTMIRMSLYSAAGDFAGPRELSDSLPPAGQTVSRMVLSSPQMADEDRDRDRMRSPSLSLRVPTQERSDSPTLILDSQPARNPPDPDMFCAPTQPLPAHSHSAARVPHLTTKSFSQAPPFHGSTSAGAYRCQRAVTPEPVVPLPFQGGFYQYLAHVNSSLDHPVTVIFDCKGGPRMDTVDSIKQLNRKR